MNDKNHLTLKGRRWLSLLFYSCAMALSFHPARVWAVGEYFAADPYSTAKAPTPWGLGFALSFPQGTGPTADLVDGGFGLDFFGGYHQPGRVLGFRMDLMFHNFKLSDAALAQLDNADDGGLRVLGGGPSLVISPPVGKRVRPSLYAGPGVYYEDASVTWDESCSPIYGCNAGDYTSGNMTTTRLGWQGGVGLDFLFDEGLGAISFNVQYVTINNTHADIEFIPVNFGYKVAF
jgi:hypothetical protein